MKKVIVIIAMLGLALHVSTTATAQESAIEKKEPCITCEQLLDQNLPDVTITSAERVTEGNPHCRIQGIIGKEIKFELLLPEKWNARYVMRGGGGFVGAITSSLRYSVNDGYATSGTNTGHEGVNVRADWALNNMERQLNFFYMAVHRTAVVSKAIINNYYGQFPNYSYFIGCSNGGKQALIEAQQYPEDFDGIVAGAPGQYFSSVCAKFIRNSQTIFPDPDNLDIGLISEGQLKVLQKAVLSQCDEIDGVKDNIINYPLECNFDFSALPVCSDSENDTICFTSVQIDAIKDLYESLIIQGKEVYPKYPFGSENTWWGWIIGPAENAMRNNFPTLHYAFGTEYFKYIVFNDPEWDYSTYDFSSFFNDTKFVAPIHDASSTNYSSFRDKGGKLIIYHGWNDGAISANASIKHYEAVKKIDPSVDNYLRLYLLPGVNHCGGGTGPSNVDWIDIVRNWVENGISPDRIVVSKTENDEVIMTRPLYPYPRAAMYDGSGDPTVESSFIEMK